MVRGICQSSYEIEYIFKTIAFRLYFGGHQAIRGVFKAVVAAIRVRDPGEMVIGVYGQIGGNTVRGCNGKWNTAYVPVYDDLLPKPINYIDQIVILVVTEFIQRNPCIKVNCLLMTSGTGHNISQAVSFGKWDIACCQVV